MKLAKRISSVPASLTLAIDAKAKEMKAQGMDLCNFTVGEPDFATPENIREAAKSALDKGITKYGPPAGIPDLQKAICEKLLKENKLNYKPSQVVVSNGGKHSLYNLFQVMVEEGDEVIVPAPYWLSYPEMVRLASATPVVIMAKPENNMKITAEELEQAITPKTKCMILNTVSNPTGAVYTRKELEAIAEVVVRKNIIVIADEIYEKLVYEGEFVSIASLNDEIFQRTIICNGFAKAYAMTGWRLGYIAAPENLAPIAKACGILQGHMTSNVCSFAQMGAIEALRGPQSSVDEMKKVFETRRNLAMSLVNEISSVSYVKPDGAFYLFIDISKTGLTSLEFCDRLLSEFKVATIPGVVFGDDRYIRISYAADNETIRKGMVRLKEFITSLLS